MPENVAAMIKELKNYQAERIKHGQYYGLSGVFSGISKTEKLAACKAVITLLQNETTQALDTAHESALAQGTLGKIMKKYSSSCPNINKKIKEAKALYMERKGNLNELPDDILKTIARFLHLRSLARFVLTNKKIKGILEPILKHHALFLSVIDDDSTTVEKLLTEYPYHLFNSPAIHVTSKYTHQTFITQGETVISIALKRGQTKMLKTIIKTLRNSAAKLTTEEHQAIKKQWHGAKACLDSLKERSTQFNFKELIDAIDSLDAHEFAPGNINEATKEALKNFRSTVLPKTPINSNEYYDIGQLLLASFRSFLDRRNHGFDPWVTSRGLFFCVSVIGYIHRLMPPEDANAFCQQLEPQWIQSNTCRGKHQIPLKREEITGWPSNPGAFTRYRIVYANYYTAQSRTLEHDISPSSNLHWPETKTPYEISGLWTSILAEKEDGLQTLTTELDQICSQQTGPNAAVSMRPA